MYWFYVLLYVFVQSLAVGHWLILKMVMSSFHQPTLAPLHNTAATQGFFLLEVILELVRVTEIGQEWHQFVDVSL